LEGLKHDVAELPQPAQTWSLFRTAGDTLSLHPGVAKHLQTYLDLVRKPPKMPVDCKAEFAAKVKELKPPPSAHELAAPIVLVAAGHDGWCKDRNQFRFLNDVLEGQQPRPLFLEMAYLRRLAGLAPPEWPLATIKEMFGLVEERGRAVAGDARAFPWVRTLL